MQRKRQSDHRFLGSKDRYDRPNRLTTRFCGHSNPVSWFRKEEATKIQLAGAGGKSTSTSPMRQSAAQAAERRSAKARQGAGQTNHPVSRVAPKPAGRQAGSAPPPTRPHKRASRQYGARRAYVSPRAGTPPLCRQPRGSPPAPAGARRQPLPERAVSPAPGPSPNASACRPTLRRVPTRFGQCRHRSRP